MAQGILIQGILPIDLAKTLKEKGFNDKTFFSYNEEQIINPDIIEKYGYLSDDGYYELTKDCGGDLNFEDVYIYTAQLMLTDDIRFPRNTISAPLIDNVLSWLRDVHHLNIEIISSVYGYNIMITKTPDVPNEGGNEIYFSFNSDDGPNNAGDWDGYNECRLYAINYILNNIINNE